jgi:hypothetical protein
LQNAPVPPSLDRSAGEPSLACYGSEPSLVSCDSEPSISSTIKASHMSVDSPTLLSSQCRSVDIANSYPAVICYDTPMPAAARLPRKMSPRPLNTHTAAENSDQLSSSCLAAVCGSVEEPHDSCDQEFKHPVGAAIVRKRRRSVDAAQSGLTQDLR